MILFNSDNIYIWNLYYNVLSLIVVIPFPLEPQTSHNLSYYNYLSVATLSNTRTIYNIKQDIRINVHAVRYPSVKKFIT